MFNAVKFLFNDAQLCCHTLWLVTVVDVHLRYSQLYSIICYRRSCASATDHIATAPLCYATLSPFWLWPGSYTILLFANILLFCSVQCVRKRCIQEQNTIRKYFRKKRKKRSMNERNWRDSNLGWLLFKSPPPSAGCVHDYFICYKHSSSDPLPVLSWRKCGTLLPTSTTLKRKLAGLTLFWMGSRLGLTVSLVSQFFSREFCGKWDSLLAKISVRVSRVSRVSQEGKNAIYCQACESCNLWVSHLRDSQTSKVIIHSEKLVLDSKFSQDSLKTPELKLVMILARVSLRNLSARLARSGSYCEISFCETRKKRFLLRNFVTRLAFHDSRYKISVYETHEKRVSLLNLTHESRKNLARILGLNSESRFSREFQKVILVSTLVQDRVRGGLTKSLWPKTNLSLEAARVLHKAWLCQRRIYREKLEIIFLITCNVFILVAYCILFLSAPRICTANRAF